MKKLVALILVMIPIVYASIFSVNIYKINFQTARNIGLNDIINFEKDGFDYEIKINKITNDFAELSLYNKINPIVTAKKINLLVNDIRDVNLDSTRDTDISISLDSITNYKAAITIVNIPRQPLSQIQNQSAQQQKELTQDEQQKATQTIQEILKIAPYIQNGITLVNGKLTLFDVAKSYGISFAQQKVAQKSPEIGALFSLGTAVQGVYAAAVPSENPAGQVIFDSINNIFLIAAWDGNNFYYNFRLKDVRSHDLSFLFKEGEIYLNNIQISKDFGDDFIRFNFFDNSNLDLNSDLFVNLDGYLQLDKNNANIEYADLKSKKDNNELNFNHVNGIPFKIALSRNGIIQYSSQDKSLITDRSKIALNKNNYD